MIQFNEKPPTLYAILNSIVNFGNDEKTNISELAKKGREKIFNFDYPLTEKIKKEDFETMILNKFIMRRIGFETITAFQIQLNVKLNEIMPSYNIMFDSLDGWNLFESGEKITRNLNDDKINESISSSENQINTDSNTSTNEISDRRYSENPQDELQNIQDGKYVTDYNYDNRKNNGIDKSESIGKNKTNNESKDKQNLTETITRTPADKISIYKNFIESKNNIYTMIFSDLESLFYGLL